MQPELFEDAGPQSRFGMHAYEQYWRQQGFVQIAGTDEAGRGPLAGPVVAAAVILPAGLDIPFLNDSKQLTDKRRRLLFTEINEKAIAVAWSQLTPTEIDLLNIYQASRQAMLQALAGIKQPFDLVLSDAMPLPDLTVPCVPIIRGDALSASIAAASVIAKVVRDDLMAEFDELYPGYGFRQHKGYGTPAHLKALRTLGPCAIHRRSFAPVKSWRSTDED